MMLEKIQQLLHHSMEQGNYQQCIEILTTLKEVTGMNVFIQSYEEKIYAQIGPQIALICMDCTQEYVDDMMSAQVYQNVERVFWSSKEDSFKDIIDYVKYSSCEYITFLEPRMHLNPNKIVSAAMKLDRLELGDMVICAHNHADIEGVVAHYTNIYTGLVNDNVYDGKVILDAVLEGGENLFGNLSCMMVRKEQLLKLEAVCDQTDTIKSLDMRKLCIYLQLIQISRVVFVTEEQATIQCQIYQNDDNQKNAYFKMLQDMNWETPKERFHTEEDVILSLKKEITFIYADKGEYYNMLPIADEAKKEDIRFYLLKIFRNNVKLEYIVSMHAIQKMQSFQLF